MILVVLGCFRKVQWDSWSRASACFNHCKAHGLVGACAPVPASSTSTSCYELTACKSLHHAIAFYPRPLHHPIQSATLTEHTFARFLHRHCFQLELRIEVPSLSVSALLLPPSIRYKVQDFFNEFKFKHSFWKLFLVLSFKRVFLREKKRKSRVAAESLGGVQARLESSITKVGHTWSHWHKGLPWFINMFIQCLSWFITRYCYHIGTFDLAISSKCRW